jgi:hypothetical protein
MFMVAPTSFHKLSPLEALTANLYLPRGRLL